MATFSPHRTDPRIAPDLKITPRASQDDPRTPPGPPRTPKDLPRDTQRTPRDLQGTPKDPQGSPRTPQRTHKGTPMTPKREAKGPPNNPTRILSGVVPPSLHPLSSRALSSHFPVYTLYVVLHAFYLMIYCFLNLPMIFHTTTYYLGTVHVYSNNF